MDKKRLQWELVKESAPDVADWLTSINRSFGKPAAVQVVVVATGELVVESGMFEGQRFAWDGEMRGRYGKR